MVMHKVQLVSKENPNLVYHIYVHPSLVTDWGGDDDNEKIIWSSGSIKEFIDGREITLVDISPDVLNDLGGGDDYYVSGIILLFTYYLDEDIIYAGRNPLNFTVRSYHKQTGQHKLNYYKLLDYNVPHWYMKLDKKYQQSENEKEQLAERIKQLEYELLHEKYQPGGSGYREAKDDFERQQI